MVGGQGLWPMNPLMAFALAAMTATAAFGTAQVPNKLILDGKEVPLFGNPLDSWLEKNPPKPEFCHDEIISSNNWRGYQATWKISGDRLLLLEVAKMHSVPKWRSWLSDNGYEYRAVPESGICRARSFQSSPSGILAG